MNKKPRLLFCLLMDAIGWLTYIIPFFGEWGDLFWAPVSTFMFYRMFGGRVGLLGGMLNFVEEILPFSDFIPTFTLAYLYRKFTDKDINLK